MRAIHSLWRRRQQLLAVGLLLFTVVVALNLIPHPGGDHSPIVWYAGRVWFSLGLYFCR